MQATQNFKQLVSLSTSKIANPIIENLPVLRAIKNFLALAKYHLASHTIPAVYKLLKNELQHLISVIIANPLPNDLQSQAIEVYLLLPTKEKIPIEYLINLVAEIDLAQLTVIGKENMGKIIPFEVLETLFALNPHAHTKNILEHNEAAFATNFGFLVAIMHNQGQLALNKKQQKELSFFLQEAVIRYGAYAAVLGFWQPDLETTNQIIRNIEILIAAIKLRSSRTLPSLKLEQMKEKLLTA